MQIMRSALRSRYLLLASGSLLILFTGCTQGRALSTVALRPTLQAETVTPAATGWPQGAQTPTVTSGEGSAVGVEGGSVLAEGMFEVPAAMSFGEPGFHFTFNTTASMPADFGATAGMTLVVELVDKSRPELACGSNHPLSGCATIDWSDFEGRPGVPQSGVFDNRLTLETNDGSQDFFLTERSELALAPDDYSPG